MPLGSVAGYQAALETTNTSLSYGMESTWATLPTTTFQAVRIISENLKHTKTRQRPTEIRGDRQAAPGLTTQETASGTVTLPVYYSQTTLASPFDDFLSATLGGDWQVPTTFTGVGGDISLTSIGGLNSTTSGKFNGVVLGGMVKLNGFINTINNGFYRVAQIVSPQSLVLAPQGFTPVTETPSGANAKVTISNLRNFTSFKSVYFQQRLDPAGTKYFRYPGAYPTKCSITLALNSFMQASFDFAAQQELKALTDGSTGGIVAAPSTRVFDPVNGFKGCYFNDVLLSAGVNSCGFDFMNDGAAGEYFLGSPLAAGMLGGTFMANGKLSLAFKDFQAYDLFRAESQGVFTARYGDIAGNTYVISLNNATMLFDNGVNADGPNKMLMADVTLEGNVEPNTGVTVSIDRFAAGV